jgi:hypothetical protein
LLGNADYETIELAMVELYERLRQSLVEKVSALGDFQRPLRVLRQLVGIRNCAKALVNLSCGGARIGAAVTCAAPPNAQHAHRRRTPQGDRQE